MSDKLHVVHKWSLRRKSNVIPRQTQVRFNCLFEVRVEVQVEFRQSCQRPAEAFRAANTKKNKTTTNVNITFP